MAVTLAQKLSSFLSSGSSPRSLIYAAPFDALAYNGLTINSAMDVSQGQTGTAGNIYPIDGWKLIYSGTMALSASPYASFVPAGFKNYLLAYVNTAQTSLAAGDYAILTQPIEGVRIARLAWGTTSAQPITIGFWSCHWRTGLYSGAVRNGASNRSYVFSYTHNASNVAQYNTVTIPGDTTGTWPTDNTAAMFLSFAVASGSTYIAPSTNTWTAGNYFAASGQTNAAQGVADQVGVTGVMVLPGTEVPTAARSAFIMRHYDQELLLCKRYFYNGVPPLRGTTNAGANGSRLASLHPVLMRIAPALNLTVGLPVYDGSVATTITSIAASYSTASVIEVEVNTAAAFSAGGRPAMVYQGSGGNINVDARL